MPGCLWSSARRKAGAYFIFFKVFFSVEYTDTVHALAMSDNRTEKNINGNVSAAASSAKSVQEMKWRSRQRPSFVRCPVGKSSSSRSFWA